MPNTRIEAVLHGIGDGARLEQLVSDLLQREGYDVDPTGTRGPDGGRDALLQRDSEHGILHCSVSQDWEPKVHEDAEKAADRPEDFDFFIFATTQNPAAVKRDRVEDEIHEEYGWRVEIRDLERLRNQLAGDSENHDLVRDHLNIDPSSAFHDPTADAEEFYESRLQALHEREGYYGTIASDHEFTDHEDLPILAIHIIPAETFGSDHDRLGSDLPDPPGIGGKGRTEQYGDFVLTGSNFGLNGDDPFRYYACFHEEGWAEAVTVDIIPRTDDLELTTTIDKIVIEYIEDALDWYEDVGIAPPYYVYVTLLNAADYTIFVPNRISGPLNRREIGSDEFQFGDVIIDRNDVDVPAFMRKPMYRLWNRTGWQKSLNYNEIEEEGGETRYEWDPRR
ncbi:PDDEXK family nuclease [Halorarum salinum]|uniref:Restriction endonuclease n=1 Tax=Halorarum salinum TaxID=2743089 RepID=A0A7D5LAQ9_9EURY|nr:restriction endonuclease [Halobaculum salinum]QLG62031.1 hypothetical protein HUG12_09960 [Halobaculum salinum]